LDASGCRERSRDDDPSVVLIDRAAPHSVDRGPRLGSRGSGVAARRIDVEESVRIVGWKKTAVVGQHRASQVINGLCVHSLSESG
jgi:hypothetical protein